MIAENINCNYIKLTSAQLADFVDNIENYSSLTVKANVNCCDEVNEIVLTDVIDLDQDYSVVLPVDSYSIVAVKKIVAEDITTGQLINVVDFSPFSVAYNITGVTSQVEDAISNYFDNLGVTSVTQQTSDENGDLLWEINIVGNKKIRLKEVVLILDGIEVTKSFSVNLDLDSAYLDDKSIILPPNFFNKTSFKDGIYSLELVFNMNNDLTIEEKTCFFFDCEIKCKVSKRLAKLEECDSIGDLDLFNLHFTLTTSNNCPCNCDEMCVLYKKLLEELDEDTNCNCCNECT